MTLARQSSDEVSEGFGNAGSHQGASNEVISYHHDCFRSRVRVGRRGHRHRPQWTTLFAGAGAPTCFSDVGTSVTATSDTTQRRNGQHRCLGERRIEPGGWESHQRPLAARPPATQASNTGVAARHPHRRRASTSTRRHGTTSASSRLRRHPSTSMRTPVRPARPRRWPRQRQHQRSHAGSTGLVIRPGTVPRRSEARATARRHNGLLGSNGLFMQRPARWTVDQWQREREQLGQQRLVPPRTSCRRPCRLGAGNSPHHKKLVASL